MSICYITAFLDIGRNKWINFNRTFEQYLSYFYPFINLFKNDNTSSRMYVFIDTKHIDTIYNITKDCDNIKIIELNDNMLDKMYAWTKLEKEREIMKNEEFQQKLCNRRTFNYPEHNIPEYSIINHCKIDFVSYIIDLEETSHFNIFSWVDFGFFNLSCNIPDKLLDASKFNLDKMNFSLINKIDENDKNIDFTLACAPEKIGGFFFLGGKKAIKEYQILYHNTLHIFQDVLNIADDDQHLALQCYFIKPDLFSFKHIKIWHQTFLRQDEPNI